MIPPSDVSWFQSLEGAERTVASVALRLHNRVELSEGCFHLTFFLCSYLRREYSVSTTPIVGYVNDGRDDTYSPHAWLEYDGKKTDIALTRVTRPDVTPPGALLILDREVAPGAIAYSYHRTRPLAATLSLRAFAAAHPEAVAQSEALFASMSIVARSASAIRRYLEDAPAGTRYGDLRQLMLRD